MSDRGQRPDRSPDATLEPIDDDGPGSDPGAAHERAIEEGQIAPVDDDRDAAGPDVGDVYRSGS